jgi:hypothetical protein
MPPVLENGVSRRRLLKGSGCALLAGLLPTTASASSGNVVRLGDFESGFEGWTTNGQATLERVSNEIAPAVVTRGEHALRVGAADEPVPVIRRSLQDVDLIDHPYIYADIHVGNVPDTERSVEFGLV